MGGDPSVDWLVPEIWPKDPNEDPQGDQSGFRQQYVRMKDPAHIQMAVVADHRKICILINTRTVYGSYDDRLCL